MRYELLRRLVGLDSEHVGEDAALVGGEGIAVAAGVEHCGPLIDGNAAKVAEGRTQHGLAVGGQRGPATGGVVDADAVLGRELLERFGAGKAALALVFIEVVDLVELADDALLVRRSKVVKAGVSAQHALLIGSWEVAMLVEPVAQMAGLRVALRRGGTDNGAGIGLARGARLRSGQ